MRATRFLLQSASAAGSSPAPQKVSIFRSNSNNPFVNLAVESYLFNTPKDPDEYSLYLWRNGPSVIIGQFQSAWRECEVQKMENDGVHLVRRSSGGGAVYQDLGNSIFSFLSPKKDSNSIARNNKILLDALHRSYNIEAAATGRNDLNVGDRKISGAAFRNTKDRSLHHGTLLLNVDMTALSRYLTPNKVKLQSKGVSSVAARVLNLQDAVPHITHEGTGSAIAKSFIREHMPHYKPELAAANDDALLEGMIQDLDMDHLVATEPHVQEVMARLQDWDWRFGSKEPKFTHKIETTRLSWGTFDVNLNVKGGVIEGTPQIYTDALDVPLMQAITAALAGAEYSHAGVRKALEALVGVEGGAVNAQNEPLLREFIDWIVSEL